MSTPCKASCTSLFVSTLQVSSTVTVLRSFLTIILSEYSKTIHFFWRHCTGLRTAAYKFFINFEFSISGQPEKFIMWWLCDEYVISMWWVCDGYVMIMRRVCDGYVTGMWWLCDKYVMVMWRVCDGCDEYVTVIWWVCDGYVMCMWWLRDEYVMVMWCVCDDYVRVSDEYVMVM
jgi:hypothetical protein